MPTSAWPRETIGSLISTGAITAHKDGNYGSLYPRVEEFGDEGVPFLTAKSLDAGRIDIDGAPRLAESRADALPFGFVQPGDVLLSHNATIGRVAVVPDFEGRMLVGTSLTYFRLNSQKLRPRYFAAFLAGTDFQNQLVAVMSHSTRNQVPITAQRSLSVVVPPLEVQDIVAVTVGQLDDKIEQNRRTGAKLEGLARAVFKAWFVDFEPVKAKAAGATAFPGMPPETFAALPTHFEDSELGPVPEGWEAGTLSFVANVSGGRQLTRDKFAESGKYLVFGANGVMGRTASATHDGFVIVFGRVWAYCGSLHWSLDGAWINNNASAIIPKRDAEWVLQLLLTTDFAKYRKGSAQPFIPNSALTTLPIVIPDQLVVGAYCDVAKPLRRMQSALLAESAKLATLRDYLLPRLLSGRVRVTGVDDRLPAETAS